MNRPLGHLHCLHALALIAAILVMGFWSMDGLTEPADAPAPVEALSPDQFHDGSRRVFLFLVDSLAFETAIDPELMPNLVALQARSTYGKMDTVVDAVSVPAMRAAFTGRDRVTVFGFVKNLWHGAEGFDSLFTQSREAGLRSLVYSDGSLMQFGEDLPEQREIEPGTDEQVEVVHEAMDAFAAETYDLVIAHVTFTDTVAHVAGVHSERYREEFRIADDLVAQLDEVVPDDATLIVMGDHGHDEFGRHLVGMDVPTFALIRGPGHAQGLDLEHTHIADMRYFMSWAMKLTLPADYPAGRYPEALRGVDAIPAPFLGGTNNEAGSGADRAAPPRRWIDFGIVTLTLALLTSIWVGLIRPRDDAAGAPPRGAAIAAAAGAWIAIALLGVASGARPWNLAALAVSAAAVAIPVAQRGWSRRELLWTVAPAAVLLFVPWGFLISVLRPLIGWPRYRTIVPIWAIAIGAAFLLSLRAGAVKTAWILGAIAGLLLVPTVYPYGTPAAMAPVWFAMLLLVAFEDVRRRRRQAGTPLIAGAASRYGLLAPIVLLLIPFALVYSVNFEFICWHVPGVMSWFWGGGRGNPVPAAALVVALLAKLVIFVPWRGGRSAMGAGAVAAVGLHLIQVNWVGLTPEETPRWTWMILLVACFTFAGLAGRLRGPQWRGVTRVAWLFALAALFHYTVRVDLQCYLWADSLLAALFLTARFLTSTGTIDRHPSLYAFLLLLAALISGWASLAWTFHRMEWGFLFDWFPVRFTERSAAYFAVPLALRFCIPLLMARLLLAAAIGDRAPYPHRTITLLAGAKLAATMMIALGLGLHQAGTDAYLEAVQQTAIWACVFAGLPWRGHSVPFTAPAE